MLWTFKIDSYHLHVEQREFILHGQKKVVNKIYASQIRDTFFVIIYKKEFLNLDT